MRVLKRDVNQAFARNINTFGGCLDYTIAKGKEGWEVEVSSELTPMLYCIAVSSKRDLIEVPRKIASIAQKVMMEGVDAPVVQTNNFSAVEEQLRTMLGAQ